MMMKKNKIFLYTIGFTGTTAENFFKRLKENNISKLIDIRLNNKSQLSGFAKKDDIKFFLSSDVKIPLQTRFIFSLSVTFLFYLGL